jgi:hypothetical protein
MKTSLLSLALLLQLSCAASFAQEAEAPFGLNWGMSTEQIKSIGVELTQKQAGPFGQAFVASKLPKAISDQETTILFFGHDDRLWRIAAISSAFDNDPYGFGAKKRYEELLGVLNEKYGKGRSVHQLGDSIYSEPKYFAAGISGGESIWFTNFDRPDVFIQIGLTASDNSTIRWRIVYENKLLKKDFEQDQKTREKGSL